MFLITYMKLAEQIFFVTFSNLADVQKAISTGVLISLNCLFVYILGNRTKQIY